MTQDEYIRIRESCDHSLFQAMPAETRARYHLHEADYLIAKVESSLICNTRTGWIFHHDSIEQHLEHVPF